MVNEIEITWTQAKAKIDSGLPFREVESSGHYNIYIPEGRLIWLAKIYALSASADLTDYEDNYQSLSGSEMSADVKTASEKADKNLRSIVCYALTDLSGIAEVCFKVPASGRYISSMKAEFEVPEYGDRISALEIIDNNRQLAWSMALAIDPGAVAPLDDSTVQSSTAYNLYPIVGYYDEKDLPASDSFTKGTIYGGMGLTSFAYKNEVNPIGGLRFINGGLYISVTAQKGVALINQKFTLTINWAEDE